MEEEEELWSWLQEVCEAQSFSNPGWVTPEDDFQRLNDVDEIEGSLPRLATWGFLRCGLRVENIVLPDQRPKLSFRGCLISLRLCWVS